MSPDPIGDCLRGSDKALFQVDENNKKNQEFYWKLASCVWEFPGSWASSETVQFHKALKCSLVSLHIFLADIQHVGKMLGKTKYRIENACFSFSLVVQVKGK